MAEAEDLLQDLARHATVRARQLWRAHRPAPPPAGTALADAAQRLDLLLVAVFGRPWPLRVAQAAAPATLLARLLQRGEGPRAGPALPSTDGQVLWLPAEMADAPGASGLARLRLAALRQASRAARGSAGLWQALADEPAAQALFLVSEAHAADLDLVRRLPGTATALAALRQRALLLRPLPSQLPRLQRAAEHGVRDALAQPLHGPPPDAAWLAEQARAAASPLPAPRAWPCHRDEWTGEFQPLQAPDLAPGGDTDPDGDAEPPESPESPDRPRSARLPRSPARRPSPPEPPRSPGAWMVQTAQPHEKAEDPGGLQRPSDRDTEQAAEEFADALSELPQARLVTAPGRPREFLLSPDAPEGQARGKAPPAPAAERWLSYPEWDWRTRRHLPDAVSVHLRPATETTPDAGSANTDPTSPLARAVQRRFEALRPRRVLLRRQLDGSDIDVGACVEAFADRRAGQPPSQRLYQQLRRARRDLAILLLADVSGSTDSWISGQRRVIDVEREALLLVTLALHQMDGPWALQAFSGEGPQGVVVRELKAFGEPFGDPIARRIAALEPEQFTRAGAALRHASATLAQQPARHRLLLLLSDGKPNDLDHYEGRYGVEDMRQAVIEARGQGVNCFCLTIDRQAADYLPRIFGPGGYGLLQQPQRLPELLLGWLQRLARE